MHNWNYGNKRLRGNKKVETPKNTLYINWNRSKQIGFVVADAQCLLLFFFANLDCFLLTLYNRVLTVQTNDHHGERDPIIKKPSIQSTLRWIYIGCSVGWHTGLTEEISETPSYLDNFSKWFWNRRCVIGRTDFMCSCEKFIEPKYRANQSHVMFLKQ